MVGNKSTILALKFLLLRNKSTKMVLKFHRYGNKSTKTVLKAPSIQKDYNYK